MNSVLRILLHGTFFCIIWIITILLVNALFGLSLPPTDNPGWGLLLTWSCCLLEVAALHLYLSHCRLSRLGSFVDLFLIMFLLQFVFTQIETGFYLDQQTVPGMVILSTVLSGLITSLAVSAILSYSYPVGPTVIITQPDLQTILFLVLFLGIVIYPIIYFTAGYFIAWQSETLRVYYSGSTELVSYFATWRSNIQHGIFTFQAVRGMVWAAFAIQIIRSLNQANWKMHGVILGILFAVIMTAQLLIPNPYMPADIRYLHLVETASSNFLWGLLISLAWHWRAKKPLDKQQERATA